MDVKIEITQIKIRGARTLPCYRLEDSSPVSYSSDVTDHELVFGCTLPFTVAIEDGRTDREVVHDVLDALHSMVGDNVALLAELKAKNGVALPIAVKLEYGQSNTNGIRPKAKVEGL